MNASMLTGIGAVLAGAALVASANRNTAVDAGAILAHLDSEGPVTDEFTERLRQPVMTRIIQPLGQRVAARLGSFLPSQRAENLRHRLLVAGVSADIGPEEFVILQAVAGGFGLVLGLGIARLYGEHGFAMLRLAVLLLLMGVFAPVAWLRRKRDERQASIRKDLPDVLDLLAISVEAGVGFEGAVEVVTRHFKTPLAAEFGRTLREMELGLSRRDALQNLKRRTEVPELSNFVLILVQADALGMPIGRVLRTQAVEMRSKRRQWAREKAGKLPVKMLVPLTIFILPAIFVVILGPAAISIMNNIT